MLIPDAWEWNIDEKYLAQGKNNKNDSTLLPQRKTCWKWFCFLSFIITLMLMLFPSILTILTQPETSLNSYKILSHGWPCSKYQNWQQNIKTRCYWSECFLSCHNKYICSKSKLFSSKFIMKYPPSYIYILKVISIIKFRHMSNF